MTDKDYQALAIVLARTKPIANDQICDYLIARQWQRDVQAIADHCVLDNPRTFNRQRFIDACNGAK